MDPNNRVPLGKGIIYTMFTEATNEAKNLVAGTPERKKADQKEKRIREKLINPIQDLKRGAKTDDTKLNRRIELLFPEKKDRILARRLLREYKADKKGSGESLEHLVYSARAKQIVQQTMQLTDSLAKANKKSGSSDKDEQLKKLREMIRSNLEFLNLNKEKRIEANKLLKEFRNASNNKKREKAGEKFKDFVLKEAKATPADRTAKPATERRRPATPGRTGETATTRGRPAAARRRPATPGRTGETATTRRRPAAARRRPATPGRTGETATTRGRPAATRPTAAKFNDYNVQTNRRNLNDAEYKNHKEKYKKTRAFKDKKYALDPQEDHMVPFESPHGYWLEKAQIDHAFTSLCANHPNTCVQVDDYTGTRQHLYLMDPLYKEEKHIESFKHIMDAVKKFDESDDKARFMIIPTNARGAHWGLTIYDKENKTFEFYNSYRDDRQLDRNGHDKIFNEFQRDLQKFDPSYKCVEMNTCGSLQTDTSQCGSYIILFAQYRAEHPELTTEEIQKNIRGWVNEGKANPSAETKRILEYKNTVVKDLMVESLHFVQNEREEIKRVSRNHGGIKGKEVREKMERRFGKPWLESKRERVGLRNMGLSYEDYLYNQAARDEKKEELDALGIYFPD